MLLSLVEHVRPASTLPRPPSCLSVLLVQLGQFPNLFGGHLRSIWEPPVNSVPVDSERFLYLPCRPAFKDSLVLNIKERVVNGERSLYVYDLVRMMREEGWLWTEEYLWHKTSTAPGKWPNRFRDSWEHLYHFTKNRKFKMNQDSVRVPIGDWAKSPSENRRTAERQDSKTGSGVGLSRKGLHLRDTVYPSNVLHGPSETRNRGHSAAFPTWIPEFFIKLFSDEGDTVLDPFLGSGTTLEAAGNLQRKGIGIEYLEKYYEVALERIEKSREEKQ